MTKIKNIYICSQNSVLDLKDESYEKVKMRKRILLGKVLDKKYTST